LPTGLSGITCDVNSSGDTSVPAETFTDGPFSNYGSNISDFGGGGEFGDGDATGDNPADGLGDQGGASSSGFSLTSDGDINAPAVADTLTAPVICDGGQVVFYRLDPSVPGGKIIAAQATSTYTMVINDIDKSVYAETRCPDPSSPTGYGEPIASAPVGPIALPAGGVSYNFYDYGNFTVEIIYSVSTGPLTTTQCFEPFLSSTQGSSYTATAYITGKSFFMVTKNIDLGLADNNPAAWLSGNGSPGTGAQCGQSGTYNRNALLIANAGTESAPSYAAVGLWGANIGMVPDYSYSGSHSTSIVSIKLNENVPGLGVIGDNISELATYSALPYSPN
jgi:hypothetical protein